MHLLSIFLSSAFLIIAECIVTDEEAEAAFAELEKQLSDKDDVKKLLQEIKDEVTAKPDHKKNVYAMAKTLAGAVPKLKSSDGLTVAEGALTVVAGVAEFFPPPAGIVIASIATLISSVLGYLSPAKTNQVLIDAMKGILNDARDKDLKYKLEGYRNELVSSMRYLKPKAQQTLDKFDVSNIVTNVPAHTGARDLSTLADYIKERATSSKTEEAKRAFQFCVLYVQIASFRDSVLQEAINLFKRAGDEDEAASYENVKIGNKEFYQNALQFLHQPAPEQAGAVVHYYPPGHSKESSLVKIFMKAAGISEPTPWMPSKYVLISVKWPSYHLDRPVKKSKINTVRRYKNYLNFASGTPTSETKIQFIKRSDGYWELKSRGQYVYADSADSPYYTKTTSKAPGSDELGQFVVIKYHGKKIVTISCRKWPDKFFNGESNKYSVALLDGNKDNGVQYYLHDCPRKEAEKSETWYYCPDFKKEDGQ